MIGYGGHMSWVSLDSLDFKYSVPLTDIVSDHLSRIWFRKYGVHMANISPLPWHRRLSSSTYKRSAFFSQADEAASLDSHSGCCITFIRALSCLCPVLDIGPLRAGTMFFFLFISIFLAPVLNKLEAIFQGSVTLHSRNLPEKLGSCIFKLKSLLNRTRDSIT